MYLFLEFFGANHIGVARTNRNGHIRSRTRIQDNLCILKSARQSVGHVNPGGAGNDSDIALIGAGTDISSIFNRNSAVFKSLGYFPG